MIFLEKDNKLFFNKVYSPAVRIKIKNVIFDSPREYLLLKTRDPYLLIRIGSAEFRSKTKTRTSRPEFNVLCEIPVDITTDMKVEIYLMDDDLGTDQEIGRFDEKLEFIEHCCKGKAGGESSRS